MYIFRGLSFIRLLSKLLDAHFFFFFMATSLYERLIPYFNEAPCHRVKWGRVDQDADSS